MVFSCSDSGVGYDDLYAGFGGEAHVERPVVGLRHLYAVGHVYGAGLGGTVRNDDRRLVYRDAVGGCESHCAQYEKQSANGSGDHCYCSLFHCFKKFSYSDASSMGLQPSERMRSKNLGSSSA